MAEAGGRGKRGEGKGAEKYVLKMKIVLNYLIPGLNVSSTL